MEKENSPNIKLDRLLVFGAGTMGQGIAQWFVQQQIKVDLVDPWEESLLRAEKNIFSSWDKLKEKGKFSSEEIASFKEQIAFLSDVSFFKEGVEEGNQERPSLIIEAISEDLSLKTQLYKKISGHFSRPVPLASNTSSLSLAQLGNSLPASWKETFLGLHFFNPATLMPLVEIIQGAHTRTTLLDQLSIWFKNKGKRPVVCQDRPGFLVNRLNRNFYLEPQRIVNSFNRSRFAEVDHIMKDVGGFKMGPFELMDLIGLDINYSVSQTVWKSFFYAPRFCPHWLQAQLVESGRLGKKSGEGFFRYET